MRWLAVAAALCAAAFLPAGPPGIGVVILAVLVAAAAAAARRPDRHAAVFGGLALVLASFAALRDAAWVVALDLAAAWLVASVAVAGPRTAAVVAPVGALDELPSVLPRGARRLAPAFRGAFLGGFVVVPFASLFLSADAAFAELGGRIPLPRMESLPLRALIFAVALIATLGLALAARRPRASREPREPGRLTLVEWAIPLASLVMLFAVFVAVQLAVLFGGHDHVLQTAGLTYAEYAREGFWELLVAGGLTLTVIGLAARMASTSIRTHRLVLRALLGALCVFTLVILASALHRLELYEDAYGLTRARLAAEAIGLWMGGAFVLVMAGGVVRGAGRRFAEVAVGGTAVALIAFSFADPDRVIAERNVAHWRETGRIDVSYLAGLSADAAPALDRLPEPLRSRTLERPGPDPWSSANLARARARRIVTEQPRSAARPPERPRRQRRALRSPRPSGTTR
jgi:Domain of unknown function (DUF4173)